MRQERRDQITEKNYLKQLLFLFVPFILQVPYSTYAQLNLAIDGHSYITNRVGNSYGLHVGYTLSNTTFNIGLTYNDLSGFKYGKNFALDGGMTSNGFGIQLSANRFFNKENRSGMFWGVRGDLQFLEDTTSSVFFSPPIISHSTAHLALVQLGYHLKLKEMVSVQFLISSGYSRHVKFDKHLIFLAGIQFTKTFNL